MIWDFDPVAISIFGLSVRWYGLGYLAGFFLVQYGGWQIIQQITKNISKSQWEDLVFGAFIFGVIGGRLGEFLFYSPEYFINDPLEIFKIWKGGMSIHGGFLGTMFYLLWFRKKHHVSFFSITDAFVVPLSFGLAIGRMTNFINGELVGKPTGTDWGVIFPHIDALFRHPSQLYESASMILLGLILFLLWKKCRKISSGFLTIMFLFFYGFFRFIVEFWKDSPEVFGPLTMGQILCILMIIIARILSIAIPTKKS